MHLSDSDIAIFKAYNIEYVHEIAGMNEIQMQSLGQNAKYLVSRAILDTKDADAKKEAAELQTKFDEQEEKYKKMLEEQAKEYEQRMLNLMATKSVEAKRTRRTKQQMEQDNV